MSVQETEKVEFDHVELVEKTETAKKRRPVGRRKRAERRPGPSDVPGSTPRSGASLVLRLIAAALLLLGALGVIVVKLAAGFLAAAAKAERTQRERAERDAFASFAPEAKKAPPTPAALLGRLAAALPTPGDAADATLASVDGLHVELDEWLTVERRHFEGPDDAQRELVRRARPGFALRLVEVRGGDLVVLTGEMLEQPAAAARALALVWGLRPADEGPRSLTLVLPIGFENRFEGDMEGFASFSFQREGAHYRLGASHLRAVRENDGKDEGAATIRCLDGAAKNKGFLGHPGVGNKLAEATATTLLYAQGYTQADLRAAKDRLTDLLQALGSPPPSVPSTPVELTGEPAAPTAPAAPAAPEEVGTLEDWTR